MHQLSVCLFPIQICTTARSISKCSRPLRGLKQHSTTHSTTTQPSTDIFTASCRQQQSNSPAQVECALERAGWWRWHTTVGHRQQGLWGRRDEGRGVEGWWGEDREERGRERMIGKRRGGKGREERGGEERKGDGREAWWGEALTKAHL